MNEMLKLFPDSIKLHEDLVKRFEEYGEFNSRIINKTNIFPELRKPLFSLELPKFDLSDIKIDYTDLKRVIKKNSKLGWTLTFDMAVNLYLDEKLLKLCDQEINKVFVDYYKSENSSQYKKEKQNIIKHIDSKWEDTLNECFYLFESGYYRNQIPFLITIIEGEIADFSNLHSYLGKTLIRKWKRKLDTKGNNLDALILYSLFYFLENSLFNKDEFEDERNSIINRNRVLHGRDNPNLWAEADYYRLINTISSIQTSKNIINDYIKKMK
ncbi:hypothetical protein ABFV99_00470 [Cytobacillus horneckiae]|uniref:hypothetical protein n=1 Tax=Cytobacillus horneckiae TaxID=549687 RepID=UPI0034CEE53E